MQRQSTLHIRDRLLTGLDKENNVVNPSIVEEVLSHLDTIQITKEELEATRLGKHINELRKRTDNNQIKARAKSLIKKWRNTFVQSAAPVAAAPTSTVPPPPPVAQAVAHTVGKTNGEPPPGGGGGGGTAVNGHRVNHKQSLHQSLSSSHKPSSSLPSSASTSPALSRPTTPKTQGGSPPLKNGTGAGLARSSAALPPPLPLPPRPPVNGLKRPRSVPEDDEGSDVDVVEIGDTTDNCASLPVPVALPPAAKKQRLLNGFPNTPPPARSHPQQQQQRQQQQRQQQQNCDNNKLNNVISERPTPGRRKTRSQQRGHVNGPGSGLDKQTDILKQQMQNVQSVKRVKTTQELVQELAMIKRSTSPGLPPSNRSSLTADPVTHDDVTKTAGGGGGSSSSSVVEETREELMNRFFDSQNGPGRNKNDVLSPPTSLGVPSPPSEPTATAAAAVPASSGGGRETVEEVMARLPPLDVASVLAEMARHAELEPDSDDDVEMEGLIPVKKAEKVGVTEALVERLNEGQTESFNGNFGHDGDFKEWHEVVSKSTVGGDLLHILPYSVID